MEQPPRLELGSRASRTQMLSLTPWLHIIYKMECLSGIEPELEASNTPVLSFTPQTLKMEYPPGIEPGP